MKKTIILSFFLAITAGPMLFSCGGDDAETLVTPDVPDTPDTPDPPKPEPELNNSFRLTQSQLGRVEDANLFSYRLLQKLYEAKEVDKSLLISPLSLVYELGMVSEGADGETLKEITKALGFSTGDVKGIRSLCSKFVSRLSLVDSQMKFFVANGMFCNQGHQPKPDLVSILKENYGATTATLNFSDPSSVGSINAWCSEKTQGKIPSMVDALDPSDVLCVMNAICFDGKWTYPFPSKNTKTMKFNLEKAGNVDVQMMEIKSIKILYGACEYFQMCELPYGDGKFCMQVILPTDMKLDEMLQAVTLEKIQYTARNMSTANETNILLPRFTTECSIDLSNTLQSLGVKQMFSASAADLNGISSDAFITEMRQRTLLNVCEDGTDTDAMTDARYPYSAFEYHNLLKADHPFLYIIKENTTGLCLFFGTYNGD